MAIKDITWSFGVNKTTISCLKNRYSQTGSVADQPCSGRPRKTLPLIQEGQLSVSGERMCTIPVNRLED